MNAVGQESKQEMKAPHPPSPPLLDVYPRRYTFNGHVGKITLAPDDPEDEQYLVTFNNGRTSYGFNQEHLQVEQDYNYEVRR